MEKYSFMNKDSSFIQKLINIHGLKLIEIMKLLITKSHLEPAPKDYKYCLFIHNEGFDYTLVDENVYMYEDSSLFNAITGCFIYVPDVDMKLICRIPADMGLYLGDISLVNNNYKQELLDIMFIIYKKRDVDFITWENFYKYMPNVYKSYFSDFLECELKNLINYINENFKDYDIEIDEPVPF